MKIYISLLTIILILFNITTYGQSTEEQINILESKIDKKRRTHKKEALELLKQMHAICDNNPDNAMFLARTLLAETAINEEQGIRDSIIIKTILTQLEKEDLTDHEELILKCALAQAYYTLGNFSLSFDISLNLLTKEKQLHDSLLVAKTLNSLGNICRIAELNSMAEEYYSEALAWAPHDDNINYFIKNNLYSYYLKIGTEDISNLYRDSLLLLIKEAEDIGMEDILPALYINIGSYIDDKYERYNYLEKGRTLYANNPNRYAIASNNIGSYYLVVEHNTEKALENLRIAQSIWEENNHYGLENVYKNIAKIHRQEGALDSTLFYIDKIMEIEKHNDSNMQMIEAYRKHILTSLDASENKLALAETKNKLKNRQLLVSFISIIGVIIVCVLLVLLFMQKRKRMKQEIVQKEMEAKTQAELLESKFREITSYSLLLSSKNGVLRQILEISEKFPNADEEIKHRIEQIVKDNMQIEDDWNEFMINFEKVHPKFIENIKEICPDITSADLKLAVYIRMGMSTKQIALMLNNTFESVKTGRYRLRKRMGLNRDENLDQIIQNL